MNFLQTKYSHVTNTKIKKQNFANTTEATLCSLPGTTSSPKINTILPSNSVALTDCFRI